jgi:predicted nucleic acid-binding protein
MDKPTVYLESSVVSYYAARPSRDLIAVARQEITRAWWDKHLHEYQVYVSEAVRDEVRRGDPAAAAERLRAIAEMPLIPIPRESAALADLYAQRLHLPEKGEYDAFHIAIASLYGVDYLVTWNCKHIANAHMRRGLAEINMAEGLRMPIICTPEELLDDDTLPDFDF